MQLFIKNMVCARCRKAVQDILEAQSITPLAVDLGEVTLEQVLTPDAKDRLAATLVAAGFELIDDRNSRLIEGIKTMIIGWVHHGGPLPRQKYSEAISAALHHDYSSLSRLFSETEGVTIEQYFILQKTERVKELMIYNERSLSQIAADMGYSSVAHLSAQFRKVTGMAPSAFRSLQQRPRKSLDEVGRAE